MVTNSDSLASEQVSHAIKKIRRTCTILAMHTLERVGRQSTVRGVGSRGGCGRESRWWAQCTDRAAAQACGAVPSGRRLG